ncbi:MAG TPA: hypothetical protein VGL71_08780, partial [Urbifossiella sp.]
EHARDNKDDPATTFVLLREARDLSAKAADAAGTVRAADQLSQQFEIKFGDALSPALDSLGASTNNSGASRQIAEVLLTAADEARFAGEWESSQAILKAASAAAAKSAAATLTARVRAKVKDVEAGKTEADKVKGFAETLKTKPDDPAANLAVGRYLCFFQQEWNAGLPLLARGSDEKLQAAAQRDLKAAGGGTDELLGTADGWYELAASADAAIKPALQIRAHHWYVAAYPDLSGINKTKYDKRLAELQPIVDAKKDKTEMWKAVRRGVGEERLKKWRIVAGGFGQKNFEEIPPGGGILIGFHCSTERGNRVTSVVTPIYLTPYGEAQGITYGPGNPNDTPRKTVKAKPGYAVGAILIHAGGSLDGFKPIFMRITETGVNPKDSYDGPLLGGVGGIEETLGGDGNFIVGLRGRSNEKGKMETMSPITLSTDPPAKTPPKKKKKP